jgi:hypothetical protein
MVDATSDPQKSRRSLQERRLIAAGQQLQPLTLGLGFLGAGALGVGTYGRWISHTPMASATSLLVIGAASAAYFAWQLNREGTVVRVGDAGVAVERGSEVERLLWCDMDRIRVDNDHLVLSGTGPTLSVPLATHARTQSWILKEAAERLPKLIDVVPSFADRLPKPDAADGSLGPILSLQTTGRRCGKSRKVIRYERDARLCTVCAQVYLRESLPEQCITCGRPLEGNLAVP